ncbi:MAG: phosphate/phosphite/phosphonate ABC transporter substrate-binding protein [Candidatus Sericytochromatia bacterium]|nr:phosphate/phosphite/phosphonate ABC transporter substrate-binding protein [Candidatus Tanganyikabacteria bacterium]
MRAALVAAALLLIAAPAGAYRPRILQVGFVPSENSDEMKQKVAPLLADLSGRVGLRAVSFVAQDYPGVVEAMRNRKVDVAFLSPVPAVMAEKMAGAKILLKAVRHGRDHYYSAIIVRKDSGLRRIQDLKGKTFAFGDPFSTAGSILPKAMFRDVGIDPDKDVTGLPPGSHDATVLAVFNKRADAGAVFANDPQGKEGAWTFYLKTPAEQHQIVPIAMSKPIPNDAFCARADLDSDLIAKVKNALLAMSATKAGRNMLKEIYHLETLKEARSADYESVREAAKTLGLQLK